MEATFVIVGGGIAGVSCVETLTFLEPDRSIILISESSLIKTVTNIQAVTRTLSSFDVEERDVSSFNANYKNVTVIHDNLVEVDTVNNTIKTNTGKNIKYKFLCLCTGARPKIIPEASNREEYVLGIRDTDSVETFVTKLSNAKKIVLVGNGGIASEIIYKIRDVEVHWVVKDKHITATFVDPGAAEFFQHTIRNNTKPDEPAPSKRMRYKEDEFCKSGAALGPDWYKNLKINGATQNTQPENVTIHYSCEVANIIGCSNPSGFPIQVKLSNKTIIPCDLIISATGVTPERNFKLIGNQLDISAEGGIQVNEFLQTTVTNIYAAGDVCSPNWSFAKHWFPMKLWTQARQMGCYAAKCMSAAQNEEQIYQDFCFELFAHSTKLFGYKVILLGLYNGQKLGQDYEILLRMTKGLEYVKFVLQNNKLQGAILIGETDLEEMCENLILNQIDLSPYGDDILNPDIDIEDYFD